VAGKRDSVPPTVAAALDVLESTFAIIQHWHSLIEERNSDSLISHLFQQSQISSYILAIFFVVSVLSGTHLHLGVGLSGNRIK
jgi:hypothetical protein